MSMTVTQQNTYYSGSGTYANRMPPLSAENLIAERNSRMLRSDPYEYEDEYPRRAVKKKKVYRKKLPGKARFEHRSSRVHYPHISVGEKAFIIFIIIMIGAAFLSSIFISAYSEKIQNDINVTKANTAALQKEIDNINILIEEEKTIPSLEKKAKEIVGMKYPTAEDKVYLGPEEAGDGERIAEANVEEPSE